MPRRPRQRVSCPHRYTIRRLPESARRRVRGTTKEWALFSPDCLFVASSWHPSALRLLAGQLQDAYDHGYAAGRLARRGRPPKLCPAGEAHRKMVECLEIWNGER
jgi:hypothetical protein